MLIESLLESESNKSHATDKSNRVDVLAQLGGGEKIIIEVQWERQWDFLDHVSNSNHRAFCGVTPMLESSSTNTYTPVLRAGDSWQETSLLASLERGLRLVVVVVIIYSNNVTHKEDYIYYGTTHFRGIHKHDLLKLREKEHYAGSVYQIAHVFRE